MSASKLTLIRISVVVARLNGSTRISSPTHEQISIADHFAKITWPFESCVVGIAPVFPEKRGVACDALQELNPATGKTEQRRSEPTNCKK
jgi:hypothetical protein